MFSRFNRVSRRRPPARDSDLFSKFNRAAHVVTDLLR